VTSGYLELNPAFRDYSTRTDKVANVLSVLRNEKKFIALRGWRDECYEVRTEFTTPSLLRIDRSATCLFGTRNYGVDINGYVEHPTKGMCIWLQQRSKTKQTWPGRWDNMIGGGLSVGHGILETAEKEAVEEGGIPVELRKNLVSVGCVSFYFESERGLFPNTEFVFDLKLPHDFVPKNQDGEVEKFELVTVAECMERINSPDFKTTSIPVILDFLIRHGVVNPENEPNFTRIIELLHVPLQKIYGLNHRFQGVNNDSILDGAMVNDATGVHNMVSTPACRSHAEEQRRIDLENNQNATKENGKT